MTESVNFKIKKDNYYYPYLSLNIIRNNKKIFEIINLPLDEEDNNNIDDYIDILDSIIEQIYNYKDDYISGVLTNKYMIEKYGSNFIEKMNIFEDEDFDYFSASLFMGPSNNQLKIVPTNKYIYFITNNQFEYVKINSKNKKSIENLRKYLNIYSGVRDGIFDSNLYIENI